MPQQLIDHNSKNKENNLKLRELTPKNGYKRWKNRKNGMKHRELFENQHASCALRAPPSTTPYHTCVLRARIRTITKTGRKIRGETPRMGKNAKNMRKRKERRKVRKKWSTKIKKIGKNSSWARKSRKKENRWKNRKKGVNIVWLILLAPPLLKV